MKAKYLQFRGEQIKQKSQKVGNWLQERTKLNYLKYFSYNALIYLNKLHNFGGNLYLCCGTHLSPNHLWPNRTVIL